MEHYDHATIQHRGRVYIFSRQRVNILEDTFIFEYYRPSANLWGTIRTHFEYDGQFCSLLVLNGYMTLYALTNDNAARVSTTFAYHPDKNEWELFGEGGLNRWGACGVTEGHHIYIIGGTDRNVREITGMAKVERIDASGDSREEVAAMNEARHDAFGAAKNGKIYVAGGMQKNGQICTVLNTCEVYNSTTNEWQVIPSLEVPRHSASTVCFKGALYVFGGLKDNNKSRELSVEMFVSSTNKWVVKSIIPVFYEDETRKQIHYRACFASIHLDAINQAIEL